MNIKMKQIIQFAQIKNNLEIKKMNIKIIYKLTKLFNDIDNEAQFYADHLQEYISIYGQKNEQGELVQTNGNIKIQEDKIQECQEKIAELENMDIEIKDYNITLDELSDIDLTIQEMNALLPFIHEN